MFYNVYPLKQNNNDVQYIKQEGPPIDETVRNATSLVDSDQCTVHHHSLFARQIPLNRQRKDYFFNVTKWHSVANRHHIGT